MKRPNRGCWCEEINVNFTPWGIHTTNHYLLHCFYIFSLLYTAVPHLRNWSILVKLIAHRIQMFIKCFFLHLSCKFRKCSQNSVSAWTLEIPANSGSPFCPNLKNLADFKPMTTKVPGLYCLY